MVEPYYKDRYVTLFLGRAEEILPELEPVDLTVTSPPYDNLRSYDGFEFNFQEIARQLYRLTKAGGVVVWIVGDQTINGSESGSSFRQALYFKDHCGFRLHDTMIYRKNSLSFPETNRYYQCFEYMFILSKGPPTTVHLLNDKPNKQAHKLITGRERKVDGSLSEMSGSKKRRTILATGIRWNIWEYNTGSGHSASESFTHEHPAIFPESLANDHIRTWSNPGDTVLDPMCGSGTVGKMARLNGNHFIGIDVSERYLESAAKRMSQEVFDFGSI